MSSTRLHPHHSLPAPVVHAGFSVSQSKSHVLAGVQDAYWSDEEAEDAECPLCLEEMDISDLNFKPCICGYQICRFCWHHIKENLNKRCPACRRVYTDDAVEFKPIATQDHKRLTQQKKQRERERKELETLGRRHLANVRVVQRNVVYVVGIGPRFAKEELIPTLRSNEYFGQYGKITKILLVKRTPSGGGAPVIGLYITYHRREDAARAIHAVDGTASPGGGREVMRASHGTTKYCMAFLRSVSCSDHGCMNLHEWGDEKDCFTKEDLTTLKHTMKATESRARTVVSKKDEPEGLPRAASWAQKGTNNAVPVPMTPVSSSGVPPTTVSTAVRPSRRSGAARVPRNPLAAPPTATSSRTPQDRKSMSTATKTLSQASSSRPPTPAGQAPPQRAVTPPDVRALRPKKETPPPPPESPTTSTAVDSDHIESRGLAPPTNEPSAPGPIGSLSLSLPILPPGLPINPPGLAAPPGLSSPSRPPRVETASPQTPLLASQSSYQMSNAARALLDDVKARRESALPVSSGSSPFPDFDRTLQTLAAGDGRGFSFNLDPKLAGDSKLEGFADFEIEENVPFRGTYVDAFPAIRPPVPNVMAPPGLSYPHNPIRSIFDPLAVRNTSILPLERQSSGSSNYMGSFNPFADGVDDASVNLTDRSTSCVSLDDEANRQVSRFGFARGRQAPAASHSSTLSNNNNDIHSIYSSTEPALQHVTPPWPQFQQDQEYGRSNSNGSSPSMHLNQAHFANDHNLPPFDTTISEAQLRDFIQSSRDRAGLSGTSHIAAAQIPQSNRSQFHDPAIMSASFTPNRPGAFAHISHGPPPGLMYPSQDPLPMVTRMNTDANDHAPSSAALSSSDFPALASAEPSNYREGNSIVDSLPETSIVKSQEIADRKAAKKAAAIEKAAERQRIALEKMNAKAAEKAKVVAEKATEKERAALEKAQQQSAAPEAVEAKDPTMKAKAQGARNVPEQSPIQPEKQKSQPKQSYQKLVDQPKFNPRPEPATITATPPVKQQNHPVPAEPITQVPLLSKKPKKVKPVTKPIRVSHKDEGTVQDDTATLPSAAASDAPCLPPSQTMNSSSSNSRSQSLERNTSTTIAELLEEIALSPNIDLSNHPFFDTHKINPAAKMPLEYGPLVHALSALSVGGGSFANNMPSGSIDNAVSSFQQLLETLTQTISDLLRLLPRTTWDDSSSFDGVLRDMLKGDDFLDDGGDDGQGKEDEVAALTLALERRARWMEVQLSKLEELHRDINTAAVRAVLSFNDNGWDRYGFMPQVGNTLRRFDSIGMIEENGAIRFMNPDELEKKLVVAKEAAVFAETEVREIMERMRALRLVENDSV